MSRIISIAIVGLGPRGLGVMERLAANLSHFPENCFLKLHLVDKKSYGSGVHSHQQGSHLLINTVAGQITMYSDPSVKNAGPVKKGDSLADWAKVKEDEYLPRRVLGNYLRDVFHNIVKTLPSWVQVIQHPHEATDITPIPSANCYQLKLSDESRLSVDFLFLTTGHSTNHPSSYDDELSQFVKECRAINPNLAYYRTCYPLDALEKISSEAVVAIQGMGLSTHDVISQLTIGRGGRFEKNDGDLRYRPSGNEPHFVLFSRQALPFSARASNQKGIGGQHQARYFTVAAIEQIRIKNNLKPLDFESHLLPVLVKEMVYAMRMAQMQNDSLPTDTFLPTPEELAKIDEIFYPTQGKQFDSVVAYQSYVREWIKNDLSEAERGNLTSPIKAATDVLRDIRDNLRFAVEFGGLTPASHRCFMEHYVPIMNRIAVGPPQNRNSELLALMEAGIVQLSGPGTRVSCDQSAGHFLVDSELAHSFADVLIIAKIDSFFPISDTSPLINNLLRNELIRPYYNGDYHPGGIDITRDGNPIDSLGRPLSNCWVLGNLSEGPKFYTYILPRPLVNSRFIGDAGKAVLQMIESLKIPKHTTVTRKNTSSDHENTMTNQSIFFEKFRGTSSHGTSTNDRYH